MRVCGSCCFRSEGSKDREGFRAVPRGNRKFNVQSKSRPRQIPRERQRQVVVIRLRNRSALVLLKQVCPCKFAILLSAASTASPSTAYLLRVPLEAFFLSYPPCVIYTLATLMHSQQSPLVSPSSMAQLLEQLALDDLPPAAHSKDSPDSPLKSLTEEPESLHSSPTRIDFPTLLTNSRDSTLTAESAASSARPSREGSCTIPAGPIRNPSTTSLHKPAEPLPPVPQYDPIINNYPRPLHMSASSPTLRKGTSILRSSSYTDQSAPSSSNPSSPPSPSSPGTPSVKFAPLPEIERPKKRKSNHVLGVAARSQMLARRKQMMRDNEDLDQPPKQLWRSGDEDEGEDPLVTLGHMVKLASVGIWRKVSLRDKRIRPGMQERSNSDSVLEVSRPVTYADDEGANKVIFGEPAAETNDDNRSLPQTEAKTKIADDADEVVTIQTQPVSTDPIPTKEP